MPAALYMDVHVPLSITRALRRKGFDVLTAQDDGTTRLLDPDLLDRASVLGRMLFTQDEDFLAEVVHRQRAGRQHASVIYAHQFESIGSCVRDLEIILETATGEDSRNHLLHIPL
ncbi:MAG: hypothetical protein B9S30_07995 [Verrucomicrobiia bacterium Tous-C5FEB]|nr:MAG: hypothetical protein B9S30_07995 [Verrucomicrobiae bacterium Tous-C5FEB]